MDQDDSHASVSTQNMRQTTDQDNSSLAVSPTDINEYHSLVTVIDHELVGDGLVERVSEWKEQLLPGAHVGIFAPSKHYLVTTAIEDAGFTIRDTIGYFFNSNRSGTFQTMFAPVVIARVPLDEPTIAENVMEYGTGALNIKECRIPHDEEFKQTDREEDRRGNEDDFRYNNEANRVASAAPEGRWPANVMFDPKAANIVDEQSGVVSGGHWTGEDTDGYGEQRDYDGPGVYGTEGGASKYFLTTGDDVVLSDGSGIDPFAYIVRLLTAPEQTVFDPLPSNSDRRILDIANQIGRTAVDPDKVLR